MAPKEPEISKEAAAGITGHITFTTPETLEIIRKSRSATSQSIITAAYKTGLLTMHGTKKHKNILPARN
jgi:ABC-type spermidine/putrescine transport system permease subunit II